MTQNTKTWVRRVYYALITAALIAVAVLLMVQCVAIYRSGDSPFTRQSIATHFAPIAVPVYVCIGLVAVGFALSPLLPAVPDSAPDRDVITLRRLQAKTDLSACPADLTRGVCRQRRARNTHHYVTLILLAVGTAAFLWYALDVSRFSLQDATGSMVKAMWVLLPCMGVPALYGVFTAYFCRRSVKSEIALLRTAPKEAVSPAPKNDAKSEQWIPFVQGGIVAVGIGLMVYGLLHNGALDVLWKAVNICQECIGLG
ncbi:MAG: hypothetical protein IKL13_06650 [Clostridia bacterium]|nr:hypothetical protein [Clostridia bacterium]